MSAQTPARPLRSQPTILVVDDDDYVHATLAAALRSLHPTVVRAATGAEGLELASSARPNLAIVDLGLPDIDGYELTRQLRARPEGGDLRIVILTGHIPDEQAARDAGADAILGKPFRLNEFLEIVEAQLTT